MGIFLISAQKQPKTVKSRNRCILDKYFEILHDEQIKQVFKQVSLCTDGLFYPTFCVQISENMLSWDLSDNLFNILNTD